MLCRKCHNGCGGREHMRRYGRHARSAGFRQGADQVRHGRHRAGRHKNRHGLFAGACESHCRDSIKIQRKKHRHRPGDGRYIGRRAEQRTHSPGHNRDSRPYGQTYHSEHT